MVDGEATRPTEIGLHGSTIVVGLSLAGRGAERIREACDGRRAVVITDANVGPLHADALAVRLGVGARDRLVIPAGEQSKSREEWARLTDLMLDRGHGRDSVVIAVGGGVVGDLAGFVAATFMRGVGVIQVPTTLLAMIDASVGGKTGVDTPAGKNLVGAFHRPDLVVADPGVLRTLPGEQLRSGLAEALKHAVITSEDELAWLLANGDTLADPARADSAVFTDLVARNVAIKAAVVERDERESGLRKVLNFGHTIGHAIETGCGYSMLHGECVGIGMRVEARIAADLGIAPPQLHDTLSAALAQLGLPLRPRRPLAPATIVAFTRSDKKARGGTVEYALASGVGKMAAADAGHGTPVDDAVSLRALTECFAV